MHGENPPNDILIYRRPKLDVDLLDNAWAAPGRIALLHLNDRADDIRLWTLWSWLAPALWRKQQPLFCRTNVLWKFNKVEGFNTMATRARRLGFTKSEHNPAMNRSEIRKLGARQRERFRMRS
jgi:hypothetical protein